MFVTMLESVEKLKFRNIDILTYVIGGLEWVIAEWNTGRVALLDIIHVQTKRLDREQISSM